MYWKLIKIIIRQVDPYDKTGDANKGVRGRRFLLNTLIHLKINYFHL